jgi:sugar phosphate isomerase/epimerase
MLDAYGIERLELEFLTDWWTQDARRTASDTVRRELLEAAAELGAQHVKAGPERGHDRPDVPRWAAEFAQLAADADAVGARVSLEFLPMFNVPALDDALEIVRSAAHPAGGVLLDIWHVRRSGTPRTAIERLPAALIAGVELNDASAHPLGSLWTDTVDHRRLPGDGDLDVPAFITAVRRTGWQGTWGVEILSAEHRRRPVADAVCDAFAASARQFALADHTATAGPSVGPDPPGPV